MAARSTITPVLPSAIDELVPTGQDGICQIIVKWFRMSLLIYRWHKYAYNADGTFTDAFEAEICYAASFCGNPQPTNAESPFYQPPEE